MDRHSRLSPFDEKAKMKVIHLALAIRFQPNFWSIRPTDRFGKQIKKAFSPPPFKTKARTISLAKPRPRNPSLTEMYPICHTCSSPAGVLILVGNADKLPAIIPSPEKEGRRPLHPEASPSRCISMRSSSMGDAYSCFCATPPAHPLLYPHM